MPIIQALLIEDNPGDAYLIRELLEESSGVQFKLDHVDRLAAAFQYFESEMPRVILLDLGLPDASGLEALIQLLEVVPMLPVVVLTGLDDEDVGAQAVSLGAQDYLVKGQVDAALLSRVLRYAIERKQAESDRVRLLSQVREQAQRIEQIMDTVPMGIVLLNDDGRISMANPVAERDLSILTGEKKNQAITHLGSRPLAELLVVGEWQELTAAGRIFNIIARPMENNQASGSWVLVIDDVTELRVTQHYQQAQEKLATVGQLAAGIAHDFNNVMSVIILYTQLLQRIPDLSAKHQQHLTLISDQAHHAAKLISQILDFSRRSDMAQQPVDLLALMKEFVKLLKRTLPENISLSVCNDQKTYVVLADPTRLQQAFMNLALNARDAMPHGGNLRYSFSVLAFTAPESAPLPDMETGQWVHLAVSDTGSGIAPKHLSHIFDPFFTTKGVGKGTGLGLAQVYGIVKQHGGFIDVQSQLGEGTTFHIYLPLIAESAARWNSESTADSPKKGTETILLVEDNSAMRHSVMEALTSIGYEVLSASEGSEAQAVFEREDESVDLMLTDLVMPGIDGVQLIKKVCQMRPNVKFLVMTGHTLEEERLQALQETAVSWITKPFTIEQLAKKVRLTLDSEIT